MFDQTTIQIAERFCGPPKTGNGGYVCGLCASPLFGGNHAIRVKYKRPAPLGVDLKMESGNDEARLLDADGQIVAEALVIPDEETATPKPVAFDAAEKAALNYIGREKHLFPTCFVCGTERAEGDGLRIFPGATDTQDGFSRLVAAPWKLYPDFAAVDGLVDPVILWSALDCPGYFAAAENQVRLMVLAEFSARVIRRPAVSERCVVLGWVNKDQGRVARVGTAVQQADSGEMLAHASGVWVAPKNWDAENIANPDRLKS